MSTSRWLDQTQFYDGTGKRGNCTQACIASLLNLPLEAVPNFAERGDEMHLWVEDWLDKRGFEYDWSHDRTLFDGFYLAAGPSSRGCSHMVVMRDGRLFHDPHPSREGLIKVDWAAVLIPHDPAASPIHPKTIATVATEKKGGERRGREYSRSVRSCDASLY